MGRRVANFGITPFKTSRVQFLVVDESGWTAGMLLNWRYPISNKWHEFYWFLKSGIVNLGVHHFEYFFLVREGWQKKKHKGQRFYSCMCMKSSYDLNTHRLWLECVEKGYHMIVCIFRIFQISLYTMPGGYIMPKYSNKCSFRCMFVDILWPKS